MFCPIESPKKVTSPAPSVTLRCWGTALRDRRRRASRWICWGKSGPEIHGFLAQIFDDLSDWPSGKHTKKQWKIRKIWIFNRSIRQETNLNNSKLSRLKSVQYIPLTTKKSNHLCTRYSRTRIWSWNAKILGIPSDQSGKKKPLRGASSQLGIPHAPNPRGV